MNTVLVVLICVGSRMCGYEPAFVIRYPSQSECTTAAHSYPQNAHRKAVCIPEVVSPVVVPASASSKNGGPK